MSIGPNSRNPINIMDRSLSEVNEKNQSEEQSILLLLEFLDYDSCFRDHKFWKYLIKLKKTKPYKLIMEQMKSNLKCSKCDKRGELLKCGHRICNYCKKTGCKCNRPISEEDKSKLKYLKCFSCTKIKHYKKFPDSFCMHVCYTCARFQLEKNKSNCKICHEEYTKPQFIKNCTLTCSSCSKTGDIIDFIELDCNHCFCLDCSRSMKKKRLCLVCSKTLGQDSLYQINNRKHMLCEKCQEMVDIDEIDSLQCCGKIYCTRCKANEKVCSDCARD
jgi:hypothetical protein